MLACVRDVACLYKIQEKFVATDPDAMFCVMVQCLLLPVGALYSGGWSIANDSCGRFDRRTACHDIRPHLKVCNRHHLCLRWPVRAAAFQLLLHTPASEVRGQRGCWMSHLHSWSHRHVHPSLRQPQRLISGFICSRRNRLRRLWKTPSPHFRKCSVTSNGDGRGVKDVGIWCVLQKNMKHSAGKFEDTF